MIKNMFKGWLRFAYLTLLELPIQFIGLFIVALAIPFRKECPETKQRFTDPKYANNGEWMFVNLPRWAKWFGNPFDGVLGDKRGWWDFNCREQFGKSSNSFVGMYIWTAIRNPANYFNRKVIGCDVSNCEIIKVAGSDKEVSEKEPGFTLLLATDKTTGKQYPYFCCFYPWKFNPSRGLLIKLGWKIKLEHNGTPPEAREQDRFKGNTIRVNLWKETE